ncbi:hypothetical protein [Reichenbachiella sp.]|uniref:hypothetical protein n=1 Tax=Reichenbachiella sp. TaxID=2184521 RepID=UPI003296C653
MIRFATALVLGVFFTSTALAQEIIPIDTSHWKVQARSYLLENYKGKQAIYLQGGSIKLKDSKFLNGTIEFDIYLKKEQAFPGVVFRAVGGDTEQFFLRPHLSGKPDANQAAPAVKGITPWQLYFGPRYSFPYEYKYDDWTHVKVVVNNNQAQVYMDYAEKPNLSWELTNPVREGELFLRGGGASGMHLADVMVDENNFEMVDFKPIERKPIEGLIPEWEISDMFEVKLLENPNDVSAVIEARTWGRKVQVEEGTAANISRVQTLYNGKPGETVFAKVTIRSDRDQIKLLEFGYSDRVIAILNEKLIYKGMNMWRSRDYRYLGTVGLFDAIYLDLKKGDNTLLMAVSESFGGWLITGKIQDNQGIKMK